MRLPWIGVHAAAVVGQSGFTRTSSALCAICTSKRVAKEAVVGQKVKIRKVKAPADQAALDAAMADMEEQSQPVRQNGARPAASFDGLEQLYQMYDDVNRRWFAAKRAYEWAHGEAVLNAKGKNEDARRAEIATDQELREFRNAYDAATLERSQAANAVALERAKLGLSYVGSLADALGHEKLID